MGAGYQAALVAVINFSSSTLRMLNPFFRGLTGHEPPSYDTEEADNLALRALRTAVTLGNIDYEEDGFFMMQWTATTADFELFQKAFEHSPSLRARERAFLLACRYGRLPVVNLLLGTGTYPATHNNQGLLSAAACGHSDIVRLLLDTHRVRPDAGDNFAVIAAAGAGHFEIVKMLLETGDVDITANENEAIRLAAMNGHPDVVELLLREEVNGVIIPRPGVDPSACSQMALKLSSFYGHYEVVELLLGCDAVNPSTDDIQAALTNAAQNGHTRVVQLLLEATGVDPGPDIVPLRPE
ncbi:hypothetical protein HDU96_006035 [Phlyctochytrium bullatum]|nr:hypothetical protein HDU96_006035 [Phlyctochytrium bullatum]